MHTTAKIVLAGAMIGAAVAESVTTANAQYYYPPPGYGRTWNGCPPGYTVQGGVCQPYQGPVGGNTFNGCPPGYTIQGGVPVRRIAVPLVEGCEPGTAARRATRSRVPLVSLIAGIKYQTLTPASQTH
jgi:hypothetical protein